MTTEKLWESYRGYSRDLTEHSRKLAFAAAAICWFFRSPDVTFPTAILWSLGLLVVYFILDVMHYLWGAIRVRKFLRSEEDKLYKKTGSVSGEISVPRSLDDPIFKVFCAKALALLASLVMLATEFVYRIFINPPTTH
jgi:hypothetical protein